MNKLILSLALLLPFAANTADMHAGHNMASAHASHSHNHHGQPHMRMRSQTDTSPQTQAAIAANAKMHQNMDILFTGDADIDFLKGMIAHHQGAVDMAQVQLKYGEDSRVKRMARDIIRNQNLEIKWMKSWLNSLEEKKIGYQDERWLGHEDSRIFE